MLASTLFDSDRTLLDFFHHSRGFGPRAWHCISRLAVNWPSSGRLSAIRLEMQYVSRFRGQ